MGRRSQAATSAAAILTTTSQAIVIGSLGAALAVLLRLAMPAQIGGGQAIFSYPAIIVVTLLFGTRAGSISAGACFVLLWYYVVPPFHSFEIINPAAGITLAVYVVVGAALVWAIGAMRKALSLYRGLNAELQTLVEQRTAERNRVWERSRELVVIVGANGCISSANPALCQLLDLHGERLREHSFESLLVAADREAYAAARREGEAQFEARLDAREGVAWIAWSMVCEVGRVYLVGRDFTAERACGEMLQQSQKMEIVGQLVGGLAHDFGNLLPPISLTLHLLRKRHNEDDRTRDLIEGAEESVDRAGQLIRRLLELSRPSRLEPTVRSLETLLDEIVPLLRQAIGHRELRLNIEPKLPDVRIDANQLDMALLNLVVNARDATEDNGVLDLEVRRGDSKHVDLVLSDNGHGMDADTLIRATEPFFSTKPSGQGTGLGLAMVHNFAMAAGGSFSVQSTKGAGTIATVRLPIPKAGTIPSG